MHGQYVDLVFEVVADAPYSYIARGAYYYEHEPLWFSDEEVEELRESDPGLLELVTRNRETDRKARFHLFDDEDWSADWLAPAYSRRGTWYFEKDEYPEHRVVYWAPSAEAPAAGPYAASNENALFQAFRDIAVG
jgi:hypothetical protein